MNKIIRIDEDVISIGTDEGSIREVRREDCSNFEPCVGDVVEIFNTETIVIVTKKEPEKEQPKETVAGQSITGIPAGGININLSNTQNAQPQYCEPPVYIAPEPIGTHVVNKVTYIVLALTLGGLGVHKFYAGYTGRGILYLVFVWTYIPSIIALIEGIMACSKPADSNGRILV